MMAPKRSSSSYEIALAQVCDRFREPLRLFIEEHRAPREDKVLLALLMGFDKVAIARLGEGEPNTLANVLHVLSEHVTDTAWGSPEAVSRWEEECWQDRTGGKGRRRQSAKPCLVYLAGHGPVRASSLFLATANFDALLRLASCQPAQL